MAAKKKKKPQTPRLRIMPLTVTMLGLLLVIKFNDIFIHSRELNRALSISSAQAEDVKKDEAKPEEKAEPAKEEAKKDAGSHGDAKKEEEPETALGKGKITLKEIEKLKEEGQSKYTEVELDILQNLAKRRDELDQREKELVMKETVLAATEERITDKIRDMKKLKEDVDKVLKLYNEKQEGEIKGLVKIYEAMKPGDAAAIFNEMEMPILLDVIDKMSERKVAPILAGMDPKRARDVTQELAELRKVRAQTREAAAGMGQ